MGGANQSGHVTRLAVVVTLIASIAARKRLKVKQQYYNVDILHPQTC